MPIRASRANPESARRMIRVCGQCARICATMRAISSMLPDAPSMFAGRSLAASRSTAAGRARYSQDHDRGPGAQVANCSVAPGHHWRGPGWRRIASSVRRRTRKRQGLGAYEHRWSPITIRGGGHPKQAMVLTPVSRMGPPPRSFAADAHGCIMVRSLWTYRIQGCGASPSCPDCELPSDASSRPQRACRRARVYQGAAWKRRRVRPAQSDGRP